MAGQTPNLSILRKAFLVAVTLTMATHGALNAQDSEQRDPTLTGSPCLIQIQRALESKTARKLAPFPELRDHVIQVLQREDLPYRIRRLLVRALNQKDLELAALTDEVRKADAQLMEGEAFYDFRQGGYYIRQSGLGGTPGRMSRSGRRLRSRARLFISEGMSEELTQFFNLIHELAHDDFERFLERHLASLAKRLPPDLIGRNLDGKYWIDQQLHSLLTEWFAYDVDLKFRSELGWPGRSRGRSGRSRLRTPEGDAEFRKQLAKFLRDDESYRITDTRILALLEKPLHQVLIGSVKTREYREALSTGVALLQLTHTVGISRTRMDFEKSISALLESPSSPGLTPLITELMKRAGDSRAADQRLTALINFPVLRDALGREPGWTLPSGRPLMPKDLIRGHPEIREDLELLELEIEELRQDEPATLELMGKLPGSEFGGQSVETFHQAVAAKQRLLTFWKELQKVRELYGVPISKASLSRDEQVRKTYQAWKNEGNTALSDLFDQLGVGNRFRERYPDADSFWAETRSVLQIYQELSRPLTAGHP